MRRIHCVLLALLLSVGCGACGNKQEKPKHLLSEQQMVDVLTDAYLIEASLNVKKNSGEPVGSLETAYYDQLFEHYGITDTILEENMRYYTRYPAVLEGIMDSVAVRLENASREP